METQVIEVDTQPTVLELRGSQVYWWRVEALERGGYSTESALRLADDREIDVHQACDLLGRGCPEQTAVLILS